MAGKPRSGGSCVARAAWGCARLAALATRQVLRKHLGRPAQACCLPAVAVALHERYWGVLFSLRSRRARGGTVTHWGRPAPTRTPPAYGQLHRDTGVASSLGDRSMHVAAESTTAGNPQSCPDVRLLHGTAGMIPVSSGGAFLRDTPQATGPRLPILHPDEARLRFGTEDSRPYR